MGDRDAKNLDRQLGRHLGKHLRAAYFGGSFSETNLEALLADVTHAEATARPYGANSIAALCSHVHFYVRGVLSVMRGEPLDTSDAASWAEQPPADEAEWRGRVAKLLAEGTACAEALGQLGNEAVWGYFADPKYSSVFTNVYGITEHLYYHIGQMMLLKRVLRGRRDGLDSAQAAKSADRA